MVAPAAAVRMVKCPVKEKGVPVGCRLGPVFPGLLTSSIASGQPCTWGCPSMLRSSVAFGGLLCLQLRCLCGVHMFLSVASAVNGSLLYNGGWPVYKVLWQESFVSISLFACGCLPWLWNES